MKHRFGSTLGVAAGSTAWVLVCLVFGWVYVYQIQLLIPLMWWDETTIGQLVTNAMIYAVAVAVAILPFWYRRGRQAVLHLVALDRRPGWKVVWLPLLLWPVYMVATTIATLIAGFIPWIDLDQQQDVGFAGISAPLEYVMVFVALVILPPIAEELLFRGYLFGRLRSRLGFWASTITVSAAFGFVHGQWNVGIDTFILSLFLCYLRESTGSLWAPIVLHMLKNALAYALLFIAPLLGYQLL